MDDDEAIRQLVARYSRAADDADPDAFSACFAPGAVLEFVNEGRRFTGHRQLRDLLAGSSRQGVHLVVDLVTSVEGDDATATSRLIELHRERGTLFRLGRYDDALRKVGGSWRFTSRRLTYDLGTLGR